MNECGGPRCGFDTKDANVLVAQNKVVRGFGGERNGSGVPYSIGIDANGMRSPERGGAHDNGDDCYGDEPAAHGVILVVELSQIPTFAETANVAPRSKLPNCGTAELRN